MKEGTLMEAEREKVILASPKPPFRFPAVALA
jgi:hypothetical protein